MHSNAPEHSDEQGLLEIDPPHVGRAGRIQEERGAQLAEYALILALVTVLSVPILGEIGSHVANFFASFVSVMDG